MPGVRAGAGAGEGGGQLVLGQCLSDSNLFRTDEDEFLKRRKGGEKGEEGGRRKQAQLGDSRPVFARLVGGKRSQSRP